MSKPVKIWFADFWGGFDPHHNFFVDLMRQKHEVLVTPDSPDLLFHSCFGSTFHRYSGTRIFFTGENIRGSLHRSDYVLSFDQIESSRQSRLPLYVLYGAYSSLGNRKPGTLEREFCSYVFSNKDAIERDLFLDLISKYKRVASGGRHRNNVGGPVAEKVKFLQKYRFNIAFENSSYPGYTTEKIVEAFGSGAVPIYWGNPDVAKEFNPASFINVHDFHSLTEAANFVMKVDQDPELLSSFQTQKPIHDLEQKIESYQKNTLSLIERAIVSKNIRNKTIVPEQFSGLMAKLEFRKRYKNWSVFTYNVKTYGLFRAIGRFWFRKSLFKV